MEKTVEQVRDELHAFCDLVRRRGWRVGYCGGGFGSLMRRKCCPVGAARLVLLGSWTNFRGATVTTALFGGFERAQSFWRGFDHDGGADDPWYRLGLEFRDRYDPTRRNAQDVLEGRG